MSPAQLHDQLPKREINGSHPSPLKINDLSHLIHKSSSPSSSSSSNTSKQQRHPVIIYTQSPKIIHTQARDFMSLVQKLTGFSSSDHQKVVQPQSQNTGQQVSSSDANDNGSTLDATHENRNSSRIGDVVDAVQFSSSSGSTPIFDRQTRYFSDVPFFTPNSMDFFCSPRPRPLYLYPDSVASSPNVGRSISPSGLNFMKELPEY